MVWQGLREIEGFMKIIACIIVFLFAQVTFSQSQMQSHHCKTLFQGEGVPPAKKVKKQKPQSRPFFRLPFSRRPIAQGQKMREKSNPNAILREAILNGVPENLIPLIFESKDINQVDSSGRTPLYFAVEKEDLQAVNTLLQHHADPNSQNFLSEPILNVAIAYENRPIVKRLLQYRADPRHQDSRGNNALHFATYLQYEDIIKELVLKDRELLNTVNGSGHSPLHIAVGLKPINFFVIKTLIALGADARHIRDKQGNSVLDLVYKKWSSEERDLFLYYLQKQEHNSSLGFTSK